VLKKSFREGTRLPSEWSHFVVSSIQSKANFILPEIKHQKQNKIETCVGLIFFFIHLQNRRNLFLNPESADDSKLKKKSFYSTVLKKSFREGTRLSSEWSHFVVPSIQSIANFILPEFCLARWLKETLQMIILAWN